MLPVRGFGIAVDTDSLPGGASNIDYSSEEQWTGRRWVDGKKIYEKTILFESLPSNKLWNYTHFIANVERFVSLQGLWVGSDGEFRMFPNVGVPEFAISLTGSSQYFRIQTFSSHPYYPQAKAAVTMQYTCTDR